MRNITIFLFLTSFLISCNKDKEQTEVNAEVVEIIPLKIGNYWKWSRTYDGTRNRSDTTCFVIKDTLINGEKWFYTAGNGGGSYGYAINRPDGFYTRSEFSEERLLFKYPVKVGDEFNFFKVISTTEVKIVKGKSYSCIVYMKSRGNSIEYYYVAPGLGEVEYTYIGHGYSDGFGLVDYKLY